MFFFSVPFLASDCFSNLTAYMREVKYVRGSEVIIRIMPQCSVAEFYQSSIIPFPHIFMKQS
jgi:hypothetical protein